jgi:hypothetical protein
VLDNLYNPHDFMGKRMPGLYSAIPHLKVHTQRFLSLPFAFASSAIFSGPSWGCVSLLLLLMATTASPLAWYSLARLAIAPAAAAAAAQVTHKQLFHYCCA